MVAAGWLNARSITKKAVAISELISDRALDVLAVTERWHRGSDDVSLRTATPAGYAVIDAARQARTGGGIAVIYRSYYKCVNVVIPKCRGAGVFELAPQKCTLWYDNYDMIWSVKPQRYENTIAVQLVQLKAWSVVFRSVIFQFAHFQRSLCSQAHRMT